jgi:glycosyltransferase involved in cell wall biosynthesis
MAAISVIIPSYNCAPYLAESLDSVLGQSVRDLEVIVVDDGSTDDTAAVLARYGGRIEVISAPHAGYAAARNLGLERARGEWIAYHDADDVALPDRLAFQQACLTEHVGADGVVCNGTRLESGEPVVSPALARRCAGRRLAAEDLFAGFPLYLQAALVRRAAFAAAGAFDAGFRIYPDMEYGYRLFARAHLLYVDRPVFRYRSHAGNVTRDRLAGREEIARILDRLRRDDPEATRRIGARRLRARLALHYYRIARRRLTDGDSVLGGVALARAIALRPLDPRLRWLRLWHAA